MKRIVQIVMFALVLCGLTVSFAHPRDVQGSRIADAIYTPQSPRAPPILA